MRKLWFFALVALLSSSCLFSGGSETPDKDLGADAATDMSAPPDSGPDMAAGDASRPDSGDEPDAAPDQGPDVPLTCGDGAVQLNEKCDPMVPDGTPGACPRFCDDGEACTQDGVSGSPRTCDAVCVSVPIDSCVGGDGCCPGGCTPMDDADCTETVVCGDGVVSGAELCDPGIAAGQPGACPTVADCPAAPCMRAKIEGSAAGCSATCETTPITQCVNGDGCCAPGCEAANDDDCQASCGNGAIDSGELCDGNCPTACDDGNDCTDDMLIGSAANCDAECVFVEQNVCVGGDQCCPAGCDAASDGDCSGSCGDMIVDPGESCDGDCPTSCDDGNACTNDTSSGSAAACSLVCTHVAITTCKADGCCPPGCTANNDIDCQAMCGNNIVEAGETCDGNCPASCDDGNACTVEATVGSPATCNIACASSDVTSCTSGDGCCPAGCSSINDNDCPAVCGNGVVEGNETCDGNCPAMCNDGDACTNDIRTGQASQCNVTCTYSPKTTCVDNDGCCPPGCNGQNDNDCSATCGNGVVEGNETCDGNTCPTEQSCRAMGPCKTLIGSAQTCTAQCVNEEGCTPCNLFGTCACPASEICAANVCTEGDRNDPCNQACNPNAFCVAWNGLGWKCNNNAGNCYQCDSNADCQPHLACVNQMCELPLTCNAARSPDAYCVFTGAGNKCSLDKQQCYFACQTKADCPQPDHACVGGGCEVAASCTPAKYPNQWCQIHENGGVCTLNNCIL